MNKEQLQHLNEEVDIANTLAEEQAIRRVQLENEYQTLKEKAEFSAQMHEQVKALLTAAFSRHP